MNQEREANWPVTLVVLCLWAATEGLAFALGWWMRGVTR